MKHFKFFKLIAMILAISTITITSCKKDKEEPVTYTITFDANGGSPTPASLNVKAGDKATAPQTNPAKADYIFLYWYQNDTTKAYDFNTSVNANMTLHARWQDAAQAEYWQVSWELNGGAWPASSDNHATQVVKGGTLAEPAAPTKAGNIFEGWYKEAAFTNKISFPYSATSDFKLYAKWKSDGTSTEIDVSLKKAAYCLAYTIKVTEDVKKGLKPSYISNAQGNTVLYVNYLPNGGLDNVNFNVSSPLTTTTITEFSYNTPVAICATSSSNDTYRAAFAIRDSVYDFVNDPAKIIACFGSFMGSSVFNSLSNLKIIANNDGITEEVYKKISFAYNCYKIVVYGKNKNGKLIGKYIGYSTTGTSFTYWHIDPDDTSFGKSSTVSIP